MKEQIISILCPSRGRSNKIRPMLDSIYNSAGNHDRIEILFYVDNDDPDLETYKRIFANELSLYKDNFFRCELTVGEPISVSKSWNIIAEKCYGNFLMMGNDDQIFVTKNWDKRLIEEAKHYPDEIFCMWFNDGINGEKHCAFPIVSRRWYETLGYFTPGCFKFLYNDTWIMDIARKIGRLHYIPDVLIEHRHWTANKSPCDDTYSRQLENKKVDHGLFNCENFKDKRLKDAKKLHEITQATVLSLICLPSLSFEEFSRFLKYTLSSCRCPEFIEVIINTAGLEQGELAQLRSQFILDIKVIEYEQSSTSSTLEKMIQASVGKYLYFCQSLPQKLNLSWDLTLVELFHSFSRNSGIIIPDDESDEINFCLSQEWLELSDKNSLQLGDTGYNFLWNLDIAQRLEKMTGTNRIIQLRDCQSENSLQVLRSPLFSVFSSVRQDLAGHLFKNEKTKCISNSLDLININCSELKLNDNSDSSYGVDTFQFLEEACESLKNSNNNNFSVSECDSHTGLLYNSIKSIFSNNLLPQNFINSKADKNLIDYHTYVEHNKSFDEHKFNNLIKLLSSLYESLKESEKIVLYGAGKHLDFILRACKISGVFHRIISILDDCSSIDNISNIPVLHPDKFSGSASYLIISSDVYERKLAEKAYEKFGDGIKIICPYNFIYST